MNVFVVVTSDTGDGMEDGVYTERTLESAKEVALGLLDYRKDELCDACGERDARGQERPEDECQCECHGYMLPESRAAVEAWDGEEPLEVEYFDGNMGKLSMCKTVML